MPWALQAGWVVVEMQPDPDGASLDGAARGVVRRTSVGAPALGTVVMFEAARAFTVALQLPGPALEGFLVVRAEDIVAVRTA